MATKSEIAALARKAEEQDVAAQIDTMRAKVRDDVLDGDTVAALKSALPGIGTESTRATNGADIMVKLYHRYDGREIEVPSYQAPRYATNRFPRDETIPREHWNKTVWGLTPDFSEREQQTYEFQCRLSRNQQDEKIKDEMRRAGLAMTCRKRLKDGGYATQFEADEHFRVKHPRRWRSYQLFMGRDVTAHGADAMTAAVQAMQAVAEAVAARNKE